MAKSEILSVSYLGAVKKLSAAVQNEGHEIVAKNMAVGLLSEDGTQRKLAFVYLDGKNYWCVFLNGRVEKYSSLSIGDVLISLFFLSSLEKEKRLSDGKNSYLLYRQGDDVLLAKEIKEEYQHTPERGC